MFFTPPSRNMPITKFRSAASSCGADPVRTWLRSSPKTTSRTQCSRFSMPQCPRHISSSRAAAARSASRLVGEVGSNKTVIASYATGSVTGSGNSFGGLVGYARSGATFTASYATGNASGDSEIGGLVGYGSDITVIASYATGRVSGVSSVGELVGYGPGTTFIASYRDTRTSGQRS